MPEQKTRGIAEDVQPVFNEIAGLVDTFCREHLNEEYAVLCRRLTRSWLANDHRRWSAASRIPGRVVSCARLAG